MVCGDEAKEKQKPEGQEVGVVSYFYLNLYWKKKRKAAKIDGAAPSARLNRKKTRPLVSSLTSHVTLLMLAVCVFHTSRHSAAPAVCPTIQFDSDTDWGQHRSPQVQGSVPPDCPFLRFNTSLNPGC